MALAGAAALLVEVEVPGAPAGTYKVCLFYDGGSHFLGAVTLLLTGKLELKGDLTSGVLAAGTVLVNPEFRVYSGGTAETCDGTLEFRSGGTVN